MLRWDWSVHGDIGAGIFFYGSIAGLALLGLAGVCGRLRRAPRYLGPGWRRTATQRSQGRGQVAVEKLTLRWEGEVR